jgi:ATP phosphoribosyltransferase regulatory subunit
MQKMKRRSGAIGFAVYMDMLERLEDAPTEYDVDTLLLYDENSDLSAIQSHVKALTENGCSVMVQRQIPENIKYRHLLKLQNGEVETLEGTS